MVHMYVNHVVCLEILASLMSTLLPLHNAGLHNEMELQAVCFGNAIYKNDSRHDRGLYTYISIYIKDKTRLHTELTRQ